MSNTTKYADASSTSAAEATSGGGVLRLVCICKTDDTLIAVVFAFVLIYVGVRGGDFVELALARSDGGPLSTLIPVMNKVQDVFNNIGPLQKVA